MKKWKLWMGIFLIFIAGGCIGAVGTGLYVRHTVLAVLNGGAPVIANLVTKRLTRKLDLSVAQQAEVSKTVRDTQLRLQRLRRQHLPEIEQIVGDGIVQMKTELTPRQQAKLDLLLDGFKARWRTQQENQNNAP